MFSHTLRIPFQLPFVCRMECITVHFDRQNRLVVQLRKDQQIDMRIPVSCKPARRMASVVVAFSATTILILLRHLLRRLLRHHVVDYSTR